MLEFVQLLPMRAAQSGNNSVCQSPACGEPMPATKLKSCNHRHLFHCSVIWIMLARAAVRERVRIETTMGHQKILGNEMTVSPQRVAAAKVSVQAWSHWPIGKLTAVVLVSLTSNYGQATASADAIPVKSSRDLTAVGSAQSTAKAAGPIKDAAGRIRYIIDLHEDNVGKPATFADANSKIAYYKAKSGQLIAEVTKLQGIELLGTTSLVGTSFTAYLTPT